ncbi:unnamed protein product, partial [Amoebophrya sp. A25]|eukprot:GSA25T00009773001.1
MKFAAASGEGADAEGSEDGDMQMTGAGGLGGDAKHVGQEFLFRVDGRWVVLSLAEARAMFHDNPKYIDWLLQNNYLIDQRVPTGTTGDDDKNKSSKVKAVKKAFADSDEEGVGIRPHDLVRHALPADEKPDPQLTIEAKTVGVTLDEVIGWGQGSRNVVANVREMPPEELEALYPKASFKDMYEGNFLESRKARANRGPLRDDGDGKHPPVLPTPELLRKWLEKLWSVREIPMEVLGEKEGNVLTEGEIRGILTVVREILLDQPMLIETDAADMSLVGDIHGQYYDLLRIFAANGLPGETSYMFLGDYVDRGRNSLECMVLLFLYKVRLPDNIFLLRGNHEAPGVNRIYGFFDEVKRKYSVGLWKAFQDVFAAMPCAGLIAGKIFCMHGGISPRLHDIREINDIVRPCGVPDNGLLCDLLWADPAAEWQQLHEGQDVCNSIPNNLAVRYIPPPNRHWGWNTRGVSWIFDEAAVDECCKKFGLDLIVRAHQKVEDGYEFYANKKLLTIFSAPNYCGTFDNNGAVLNITRQLRCKLTIIEPDKNFEDDRLKEVESADAPPAGLNVSTAVSPEASASLEDQERQGEWWGEHYDYGAASSYNNMEYYDVYPITVYDTHTRLHQSINWKMLQRRCKEDRAQVRDYKQTQDQPSCPQRWTAVWDKMSYLHDAVNNPDKTWAEYIKGLESFLGQKLRENPRSSEFRSIQKLYDLLRRWWKAWHPSSAESSGDETNAGDAAVERARENEDDDELQEDLEDNPLAIGVRVNMDGEALPKDATSSAAEEDSWDDADYAYYVEGEEAGGEGDGKNFVSEKSRRACQRPGARRLIRNGWRVAGPMRAYLRNLKRARRRRAAQQKSGQATVEDVEEEEELAVDAWTPGDDITSELSDTEEQVRGADPDWPIGDPDHPRGLHHYRVLDSWSRYEFDTEPPVRWHRPPRDGRMTIETSTQVQDVTPPEVRATGETLEIYRVHCVPPLTFRVDIPKGYAGVIYSKSKVRIEKRKNAARVSVEKHYARVRDKVLALQNRERVGIPLATQNRIWLRLVEAKATGEDPDLDEVDVLWLRIHRLNCELESVGYKLSRRGRARLRRMVDKTTSRWISRIEQQEEDLAEQLNENPLPMIAKTRERLRDIHDGALASDEDGNDDGDSSDDAWCSKDETESLDYIQVRSASSTVGSSSLAISRPNLHKGEEHQVYIDNPGNAERSVELRLTQKWKMTKLVAARIEAKKADLAKNPSASNKVMLPDVKTAIPEMGPGASTAAGIAEEASDSAEDSEAELCDSYDEKEEAQADRLEDQREYLFECLKLQMQKRINRERILLQELQGKQGGCHSSNYISATRPGGGGSRETRIDLNLKEVQTAGRSIVRREDLVRIPFLNNQDLPVRVLARIRESLNDIRNRTAASGKWSESVPSVLRIRLTNG